MYTKKRGDYPDFDEPIILTQKRRGITIDSVCQSIHKDFVKEFKYALVWGRSSKFSPQTCGLAHELQDEDVIQIFVSAEKRKDYNQHEEKKNKIQASKDKSKQAKKDKHKK